MFVDESLMCSFKILKAKSIGMDHESAEEQKKII